MRKRISFIYMTYILGAALVGIFYTSCAGKLTETTVTTQSEEVSAIRQETQEIPITTKSEEARAIFIEAREMFEHLKTNESREYFDKAIQLDPGFALAYLYRSYGYISEDDLKKQLEKAVNLMENVSEGERLLIRQRKASILDNNTDKAFELRKQLVQVYPQDKRARNLLGLSYYGRDKDLEAITEFEAAIALDKKYASPYNQLGYAYIEIGEYAKAEEVLKTYITLLPDEPNGYDSMADLYFKQGHFEEALGNYQKAVQLNKTFTSSQRKIALCQVLLGRHEDGHETCLKTMENELSQWDKILDRNMNIRLYVYEENYSKALEEADQMLKEGVEAGLPTWTPYVHQLKCRIAFEIDELNDAEQYLTEYYQSMKDADFNAYYMYYFASAAFAYEARISAKKKDLESALEHASKYKILQDEREVPNAHQYYNGLLGMIYLDTGDYVKAIEKFKLSSQENPFTIYHHGVAQSEAGNEVKAQNLFTKAANWNEDSYNFAFIRGKALSAIAD